MTNDRHGLSRRDFLATSGAGLAGAALFLSATEPVRAYPLDGLLGVQGWDLRNFFARDVDGTMKTLAGWGYQALDAMAPAPNAEGPTAEQFRQALDAAGMVSHAAHFSAPMFEDANWTSTMQIARTLGVKEMVYSGGGPSGRRGGTPPTVDSWKAYADRLNAAGKRVQAEGLQLGWHNHGEFRPIEGGGGLNPYDVLLQNTDPAVVKFQIDVGNCMNAGGDPYMYLSENPTRFFSMHVREVKEGETGLAVGEGTMDWKRIFELAKAANIHNYDVETGAPEATVMEKTRQSAEFLKNFPMV